MTNKEHQEWVIQKLNEDYVKRLEEYREVIEQQRTIIAQQKELIDKLLTDKIVVSPVTSSKMILDNKYTCIAPKDATCNKDCDSCCYRAQLC